MNVLVCYDIVENKVRENIVDILLQAGLQRVQYSVFVGRISSKVKWSNLCILLNENINKEEDSVFCLELCEKDFKNKLFFGKNKENKWELPEVIVY